jgi:small nuclear ribonucleoprotein D3
VSVSGKKGVGIPIILLHDAEGGIITIELKNGDSYRGLLDESQDTMNCTMKVSLLVLSVCMFD